MNEVLNRSVEELELSVRSYNCLKNANIQTIGDLVQKTEAEMLRTKNFGRKSLNEIKEILSNLGLTLRHEVRCAGPLGGARRPSLPHYGSAIESTTKAWRSLDEVAGVRHAPRSSRIQTQTQRRRAQFAAARPGDQRHRERFRHHHRSQSESHSARWSTR